MTKELSCGVILTDGAKLLAIVPWGKLKQLDIPKGGIDAGETPAECASRELREETGLDVHPRQMRDLGKMNYNPSKDLHLFLVRVPSLPGVHTLKCSSFFTNQWGKKVPEAVSFEHADFDSERFYPSLRPILFLIKNKLK
jgi:putative (di)nucleoside polyphosphate hydrolase